MNATTYTGAGLGSIVGLCALAALHHTMGLDIGDRLVAIAIGAGIVFGGFVGYAIFIALEARAEE